MKHISENRRNPGKEYFSLDDTHDPHKVRVVNTIFEDIDVGVLKARVAEIDEMLERETLHVVDIPKGASDDVAEAIGYYNAMMVIPGDFQRQQLMAERDGINQMLEEILA